MGANALAVFNVRMVYIQYRTLVSDTDICVSVYVG